MHRTWEFTSSQPLRTITIPGVLYAPVFFLLRWVHLHRSPYWLQVGPRLIACALSVVCDYTAIRLAKMLNFSPGDAATARLLVASSYPAFTYLTRTLSNTAETALFCVLLMVSLGRRRCTAGTICLAGVLVVGVFNRPTFALFAAVPVAWYCSRNALVYVQVVLYSIAMSTPFALVDTWYYHGNAGGDTLALTPLNFLAYNLNPANLESHGKHPRWTHALVNLPLLYGPVVAMSMCVVAMPSLRSRSLRSSWKLLTALIVVPLISFSAFGHQEARFLLPLHVPMMLLAAGGLSKWRNLRKLVNTIPFAFWTAFNIALAVFFGTGHQSGVTRSLFHLHRRPSDVPVTAYYLNTYMPPSYLAPDNARVIDLQSVPVDRRWRIIGDSLVETPPPGHAHLLSLPGRAAVYTCLDGEEAAAHILATPEYAFDKHISTEHLPKEVDFRICPGDNAAIDNAMAACKRPLVNRTRYCDLLSAERLDFLFSLHVFRLTQIKREP